MDSNFLVKEEIDAGEVLVREFNESHPISAAYWLKEDDDEPWYLYIASDEAEKSGPGEGYAAVMKAARVVRDTVFDQFRVKLVPSSDPVAQAIADINRRYPAYVVKKGVGRYLGGRYFKDVLVYPTPLAASAT